MWHRLTPSARQAVFNAQQVAERFGHSLVSTEHLLLGILRLQDPKVIDLLGEVSVEEIRRRLEEPMMTGVELQGAPQVTARFNHVIHLSYNEARRARSDSVLPEHLFLALLAEGDSIAAKLLAAFEFEIDSLRLALQRKDLSPRPRPAASPKSFGPIPISKSLLHIRQNRFAPDRLAYFLIEDPAVSEWLFRAQIDPRAIRADLEDALNQPATWEDLQNPPSLTLCFKTAARIATDQPVDARHLFAAVALDTTTFLHRVITSIGGDPESLATDLSAE